MPSQSSLLELPGFTLPLNHRLQGDDALFPNALDFVDLSDDRTSNLHTQREILMMRVMNTITDKPDWHRKVFDSDITSKWRDEITQSGGDVSPKMIDWIIQELQWKAGVLQDLGFVTVFDVAVTKSDVAIPKQLQHDLQRAAAPLENIPDERKDYHPGSHNKVVDLVHPALFPVIYGRSRILPDRRIGLDDCLLHMGRGEVLPVPAEDEAAFVGESGGRNPFWDDDGPYPFSRKFQWLPCDVEFTDEDPGCRVVSYINNAHPLEHRALYGVVERVIARAIPLWSRSLTPRPSVQDSRIPYGGVDYLPHPEPEPQPRQEDGEDSDSEAYLDRHDEWEESCPIEQPEPGEFKVETVDPKDKVDLRAQFRETGLQVIVKLSNIELTPEKPEYEGGSWHIEGQLNERICATAIYYYDCENITQNVLSFRQRADIGAIEEVGYEQGRFGFLYQVLGFDPELVRNQDDSAITQDLGSVDCREGRLLTFPNTLQHRVSPFSLADRSKPGHRKILALFLIDPHQRIISSANVPPQRDDWGQHKREFVAELLLRWLPRELGDMISRETIPSPITLEEAKGYRLELMDERSARSQEHNQTFETGQFSLCEH